jgi:hypothetical protein
MKETVFELDKLTGEWGFVKITIKVVYIPPFFARFTYWDDDFLIGSAFCQVGDDDIFPASEFILNGYFKSEEFEKKRKEAGRWN